MLDASGSFLIHGIVHVNMLIDAGMRHEGGTVSIKYDRPSTLFELTFLSHIVGPSPYWLIKPRRRMIAMSYGNLGRGHSD